MLGAFVGFLSATLYVNAAVTNTFTSGTPIVAENVNTNFAELDERISQLEANYAAGNGKVMAYLWSTVSSPALFTYASLKPEYVYNANGGDITMVRTATGQYTVTMSSMPPTAGGNIQISTYGSTNRCNIFGWANTDSDPSIIEASIYCRDPAGNLIDSRFTLLYVR